MGNKQSMQLLIRRDRLSSANYTLSLLQEGVRAGLISSRVIERIQAQLMSLLNARVLDYTHGESSSVRTETAHSILSSVLYCLDAYLKQLSNPLAGLTLLQSSPLIKLYERGVAAVALRLEHAREIYADVRSRKLDVPMLAYQNTIDALPSFLQNYDIAYAAQETMADIDYPLAISLDDQRQTGVFYIEAYLERLKLENDFCNTFPPADIELLLAEYGQVYGLDYRDALINIFEVVVNNAIFSVVSGGAADDLLISPPQCQIAVSLFKASGQDGVGSLIAKAAATALECLSITDGSICDYVTLYADQVLLPRLIDALRVGALDKLIIVQRSGKKNANSAHFSGVGMPDQNFRSLVAQLCACEHVRDKVQLISENVQSLEDYVDVLQAGCLFGDDYWELFTDMGDWELAALARAAFTEELREGGLSGIADQFRREEWQRELLRFLRGLCQSHIKAIEANIYALAP